MHTRKVLIYLAALAVVALIGSGTGHLTRWTDSSSPAQAGALKLQPANALSDFELASHKQAPFSQASLQYQRLKLYFGPSHCPDVSPTTLAGLGKSNGLLVKRQVQVAAVFTPPIALRNMADEYRNIVPGYGKRS